jgi:hypothetical protein
MAFRISNLFLAAGQAAQFNYHFLGAGLGTSVWAGPLLVVARAHPNSGQLNENLTLVTQWQGLSVQAGGRRHEYLVGIHNVSAKDVWFDLEGGKLS